MRRVVYTSRSLIGADAVELKAIVDRSCMLNGAAEITGMLWCDGQRFAQVLEGPYDAVGRTLRRIQGDARHDEMETVFDRAVSGRMFGGWEMKLSDASLECTANTAFLVGLAANRSTPSARRLFQIMLACDG